MMTVLMAMGSAAFRCGGDAPTNNGTPPPPPPPEDASVDGSVIDGSSGSDAGVDDLGALEDGGLADGGEPNGDGGVADVGGVELGSVTIEILAPAQFDEVPRQAPFVLAATGVTIAPATDRTPGTGHFVIAVDGRCTEANQVIPMDSRHVHLVGGESMATVGLPPGMRELCVQVAFGDGRAYEGKAERTVYVY